MRVPRRRRDESKGDRAGTNGGLLSGEGLIAALESGEVFGPTSWSRSRVRSTAYDLTLARDLCLIPVTDLSGNRIHKAFGRGEAAPSSFTLMPGESAFASTQERIQLDWSLSGQVGTKFSMSARGLMVMTGLCIDPGFGLQPDKSGGWAPMPDQRIHFVFANIGPDPIDLSTEDDRVASLQLFRIDEVPAGMRTLTPSRGLGFVESTFYSQESSPVLAYFRSVSDLKTDMGKLAAKVELSEKRLEIGLQGVNTVVLFGVYLLAVTILGVVFATFSAGATALLESESLFVRIVGAVFAGGVLSAVLLATIRTVIAASRKRP